MEKDNFEIQDRLSRLPFCKFRNVDDKISLEIHDESVSNFELLTIDLKQDQYKIDYKTAYVFPYKNIKWQFIEKHLTLTKSLHSKKEML